jgi:metal-sulfur cluster biosynthetic enzyme
MDDEQSRSAAPAQAAAAGEAMAEAAVEPTPEPTREQIIEVLKTVEDPELFIDIWFLGLIYHIGIEKGFVEVEMTFTSPMCPAGPQLVGEVQSKIAALPGVQDCDVRVTFNPPWEPSEEVKGMLGML